MRHTASTKRKLLVMRQGKRNPFYGRKHTAKAKKAMSRWTIINNKTRRYDLAPLRLKKPDRITAAYLAGMIDADGSIRFRRGYPFVAIYNTHRPLIRWISSTLKTGSVWNGPMGRLQVLAWNIQAARDVHALLTSVRPFLIVKASDADAALKYLRRKYPWA